MKMEEKTEGMVGMRTSRGARRAKEEMSGAAACARLGRHLFMFQVAKSAVSEDDLPDLRWIPVVSLDLM
jgi:hypothetical protein